VRVLGSPVRADRVGEVEVGEHQDVEKLGAGSGRWGIRASSESRLHLVESHEADANGSRRLSINRPSLASRLTAKR
jgi:hypothetical protein